MKDKESEEVHLSIKQGDIKNKNLNQSNNTLDTVSEIFEELKDTIVKIKDSDVKVKDWNLTIGHSEEEYNVDFKMQMAIKKKK